MECSRGLPPPMLPSSPASSAHSIGARQRQHPAPHRPNMHWQEVDVTTGSQTESNTISGIHPSELFPSGNPSPLIMVAMVRGSLPRVRVSQREHDNGVKLLQVCAFKSCTGAGEAAEQHMHSPSCKNFEYDGERMRVPAFRIHHLNGVIGGPWTVCGRHLRDSLDRHTGRLVRVRPRRASWGNLPRTRNLGERTYRAVHFYVVQPK